MKILKTLKDGEKIISDEAYDSKENVLTTLKTSDLRVPYNHIYFAEYGKLFQYFDDLTDVKDDEIFCFTQNRRHFKNYDLSKIVSSNDICLCKRYDLKTKTIKNQFDHNHKIYIGLFDKIFNDLRKRL